MIFTPHVFTDGAELWPSGREQFSYLNPEKRRIDFVVANPVVDGQRQYIVFTKSIRVFTDGTQVDSKTKDRVVNMVEEYFRTTKKRYKIEIS